MSYQKEIVLKESIADKCKDRDAQAELILKILELAKGLKHCSYEVADKVRHPDHIKTNDIDDIRKKLDFDYWYRCLEEYQIEKFLTTTDKEKLYEKLEEDTPAFNFTNVMETIGGFMNSKDAKATNMVKKIYEEITDGIFSVGNKHNNIEKRLQTGIPKMFRLSIFYIYGTELPSYVSSNNSRFNIIDDFERACYLVDGKTQPDCQKSIKSLTTKVLRKDERFVVSPYFEMKIFKNGNVKIIMKSMDVLKRLNHWGQKGNRLPEKKEV